MTRTGVAGRADLRAFARGGSLNLAGAATRAAASSVLAIAVTRGVDKSTAGVFFAATAAFVLVETLAKLGTPTGIVYFISRFRAWGTPGLVRRYLAIALTPAVVAASGCGAALFVLAPVAAELLVHGGPGDFAAYLRVLAVFLPLAVVTDACLAATRGYGRMRPTALIDGIGRPLAQLALVSIVVVAGSDILLSLAWVGPYLPAAALAWLWLGVLRRRHDAGRDEPQPATSTPAASIRDFWSYTSPRALAAVAQVALKRLDIVLVAALIGPVQAAIYTAATRLLVVGELGHRALMLAAQPRIGALLARDTRHEAGMLYRTSATWLVLAVWPVYLLFAVFAPYVLRIFGQGYDAGAPVLILLAVAMLVATVCGPVDMMLNMAGRTTWTLANVVVALALAVALDLLLIPRLGILGAAIGAAAAVLANNLVPVTQLAIALRLHPFGSQTLTAAALALLCFGVLPLAVRLAVGGALPSMLAAVCGGAVLYGLGCWHRRGLFQLGSMRALIRRSRT